MNPFPRLGTSVVLVDYQKEAILLGKRIGKDRPGLGYYATPGGKVDPYENVFECAIRETLEETGLTLDRSYLRSGVWTYGAEPSIDFMCLYMIADHWTGNLVNTEPDKCEGWNWYWIYDLPTPCWLAPDMVTLVRELMERHNRDTPPPWIVEDNAKCVAAIVAAVRGKQ